MSSSEVRFLKNWVNSIGISKIPGFPSKKIAASSFLFSLTIISTVSGSFIGRIMIFFSPCSGMPFHAGEGLIYSESEFVFSVTDKLNSKLSLNP